MAKVPVGDNLYVGRGKIFLDRYVSGARTGNEFFIGNCDSLEGSMTVEKIRKRSSAEAGSPVLAEASISSESEFTIQFNERIARNLAMFLMGDEATLAQTGASVTDAPLTAVKQDAWVFVGHRNISAVVVTSNPAGTTYVAGTDYDVDAVTGRIYIIPGGGIADDTDLLVDYDYATIALEKVRMQTQASIVAYLRFVADPAWGEKWDVELWKVSITPEGALALITDDFAASQLKGTVLSDAVNHPSEPFGVMYKVA